MAPTIEQALRAEIQAHKQALDHALDTLKCLGESLSRGRYHGLRYQACEERDYIRLHIAGWAAPTTGGKDD